MKSGIRNVGIWIVFLLFSCTFRHQKKKENGLFIQGQISGYHSFPVIIKKVHFYLSSDTFAVVTTDSTGQFALDTSIDQKYILAFELNNSKEVLFIAYPGDTITIQSDTSRPELWLEMLASAQVSSTKSSEDNELLQQIINMLIRAYKDKDTSAFDMMDSLLQKRAGYLSPLFAFGFYPKTEKTLSLFQLHYDTLKWVLGPYSEYIIDLAGVISSIKNTVPGKPLPAIGVLSYSGQKTSIPDTLRGKIALIDIWASWCTWCRKSVPFLKKIFYKYRNKNFIIAGLSVDRDSSKWKEAVEKDSTYIWEHFWHPRGALPVLRLLALDGVPAFFLVDENGKIIKKWEGFDEMYFTEMDSLIEASLMGEHKRTGKVGES